MEICSKNHEEIVFDCKKCPLCEALEEKDMLEEEVYGLIDQIDGQD